MRKLLRKIRLLQKLYCELTLLPYRLKQKRLIRNVRQRKTANVVFYAMSLPMWRYQCLYEEMKKYSCFNVHIVLSPCVTYSREQQIEDMQSLRKYFQGKNIPYIDYDFDATEVFDVKKEINPDIVFYPQPYHGLYNAQHDCSNFYDKLICYYPYAFWISQNDWSYNLPFHNVAWKLFYSTPSHLADAKTLAFNRGKNVSVVGYPNIDNFIRLKENQVSKENQHKKKKIIWAPHFTIGDDTKLRLGNFLWMADFMIETAEKYKELIDFTFRPHPRLLTVLCDEKYWGKEKTYSYYDKWDKMENTELSTNTDFLELFLSSDAMIHDCGSFTVEYHYTKNPVMFMTKDESSYFKDSINEVGQRALEAHYKGCSKDDITRFIEDVVLNGNDPMKETRESFYDSYISQRDGKSVAEKTVDEIIKLFN